MPSKIKVMLTRSPRSNKHKRSMIQEPDCVGGVSLQDSKPNIDVLDTDLFLYDYERWFAKAIFLFSLAMVIEKEHLGHACINPKDVLAEMEASYWKTPNRNTEDNGKIQYPGFEIFKQINAARLTKNEETLRTFLDQLSNDIKRHCRLVRKEAVAELDAQPSATPDDACRAVSPDSTTSSGSSLEEDQIASDTDGDTESLSQNEGEHGLISSSLRSLVVTQPPEVEIPMHAYTAMLWVFAAKSNREPAFEFGGVPNSWTCEASFDGFRTKGRARNRKKAQHIASQMLCQALGISTQLEEV